MPRFTLTVFLILSLVLLPGVRVVAMLGDDQKEDPDAHIVRSANLFCISGFGFAGKRTPAALAILRLVKKPNAIPLLMQLLNNHNEARCYALCGLRAMEISGSKEAGMRLTEQTKCWKEQKTTVAVGLGCTRFEQPFAEVVVGIRNGQYDLFLKQAD